MTGSRYLMTIRFATAGATQALNRIVSAATVEVTKDGRPAGLMTSEKAPARG
jgi:hypothetical protein